MATQDSPEGTLLEKFWSQGMKRRTSDLVPKAASETGQTTSFVKAWISKKQQRVKQQQRKALGQTAPPRKKKDPLRKKRGCDLFLADWLNKRPLLNHQDRSQRLKEAHAAWRNTEKEEKAKWLERAGEKNQSITFTNKDRVKLESLCRKVWKSGLKATLIISEEGQDTDVICPPESDAFWMRKGSTVSEYGKLYNGKTFKKKTCNILREEVQELFNEKFGQAIGKPYVKCDYLLMDSGELKAVGLPAGLTLKRPSKYTVPEKKAILAGKEEITFEVIAVSEVMGDKGVEGPTREEVSEISFMDVSTATTTSEMLSSVSEGEVLATTATIAVVPVVPEEEGMATIATTATLPDSELSGTTPTPEVCAAMTTNLVVTAVPTSEYVQITDLGFPPMTGSGDGVSVETPKNREPEFATEKTLEVEFCFADTSIIGETNFTKTDATKGDEVALEDAPSAEEQLAMTQKLAEGIRKKSSKKKGRKSTMKTLEDLWSSKKS